jgi:hypothetical protein
MVAVDAVIIEVLFCNDASMRYIFKGEKPANLPAQEPTKYQLALSIRSAHACAAMPAQSVDATQALNLSAGVSNCKVSRGRSFS